MNRDTQTLGRVNDTLAFDGPVAATRQLLGKLPRRKNSISWFFSLQICFKYWLNFKLSGILKRLGLDFIIYKKKDKNFCKNSKWNRQQPNFAFYIFTTTSLKYTFYKVFWPMHVNDDKLDWIPKYLLNVKDLWISVYLWGQTLLFMMSLWYLITYYLLFFYYIYWL